MILETSNVVEIIRQGYNEETNEPLEEWIRGVCPQCEGKLVSNVYYVGGKGYICVWECWNSLRAEPTCSYRKVL